MAGIVRKVVLCLFLAGLLAGGSADAQHLTRVEIDSLTESGRRLLNARNTAGARKAFKRALDADEDHIPALLGMADADFQERDWGGASDWYGRVLDRDTTVISASYGRAVSKRELGKNRMVLQRALLWRAARRDFKRAAKLDSSYRDIFYQWALLERYWGNYYQAVELGRRQLNLWPSAAIRLGLLQFYDYLLEHSSYDSTESWLKRRSGVYDRYALAELYRRHDRFESADSLFRALARFSRDLPREAVCLAQVRLYVQTGHDDMAEETYWKAVDRVKDRTGVELVLQDFMTIISIPEYRALEHDVTLENFAETMHRFWELRDPLPASPLNDRLIEHYRRTLYAEKYYRYDGFRHRLSMRDRMADLKRPPWVDENYRLNDLGLVYIRFGEPDEQAFEIEEDLNENMSWLYYARGDQPKLIFHFAVPSNAAPGLWVLVSQFDDRRILEQMLHWDRVYQDMYMATGNEFSALQQELATRRALDVQIGLSSDRHTWPVETTVLPMIQRPLVFRESEDIDLIKVVFAIPEADLYPTKDPKDTLRLETGIVIYDARMREVYNELRLDTLWGAGDDRLTLGYYLGEFESSVSVEDHNLALHARLLDTHRVNAWKYQVPPDTDRSGLALSSLELAYEIRPDSESDGLSRQHLNIQSNPTGVFDSRSPVFVYYEIYNLNYDSEGLTQYVVHISLRENRDDRAILGKFVDLFRRRRRALISIRNRLSGQSRNESDYLNVDLSRTPPGHYDLMIVVEDLNNGDEVRGQVDLTLR